MIARVFMKRWAIWVLAATILALGIYLSWLGWIDRNWLARAGSVVVVLGIASSLSHMLHIRMLANTLAIRKRYRAARIRRKYRGDPESVATLIREMEERVDRELAEENELGAFSVGVMEAALVMVGTLVWGFGDLVALAF